MKLFFVICLSVLSTFLKAQANERIASILKIPRTTLVKLETPKSPTVTYLVSPFSKDILIENKTVSELQNTTIVKVYYVYTKYKLNSSFNQLELDKRRFLWLEQTLPGVLQNEFIEWEILEQTGCDDYTNGLNYFHGFVIIHRPIPTAESRAEEIEQISNFIDHSSDFFESETMDPILTQLPNKTQTISSTPTNNSMNFKPTPALFPDGDYALLKFFQTNLINTSEIGLKRIDTWVDVKFTVKEDGTIDSLIFLKDYPQAVIDEVKDAFEKMPEWNPAKENGKPTASSVNLQIRVSYSGEVKGMYTRDKQKPNFNSDTRSMPISETDVDLNLMKTPEPLNVKTGSVYKGLELMKNFQRTALVMDVTGSMTIHIAGMLNWIRTNYTTASFTSYSFFNDGNNKSTKSKKIGETGGIYLTKSIGEVDKLIKEAMMKGNGGEAPENDLEAVIYALTNDENADEVLLIADNYSEVRDISLLNTILKPVNVILCAAPKFVRCEYLKIAKETGGLFIVNGESINLKDLSKGDIVSIQKVDYRYTGNNFEFVNKGEVFY